MKHLECSDMAVCNEGITQFYLPPTHELYMPFLPNHKVSLTPFGIDVEYNSSTKKAWRTLVFVLMCSRI